MCNGEQDPVRSLDCSQYLLPAISDRSGRALTLCNTVLCSQSLLPCYVSLAAQYYRVAWQVQMYSACGFYITNPVSKFIFVIKSSHASICYTLSEPIVHCQLSHTSI
jgi:hypothetical protein